MSLGDTGQHITTPRPRASLPAMGEDRESAVGSPLPTVGTGTEMELPVLGTPNLWPRGRLSVCAWLLLSCPSPDHTPERAPGTELSDRPVAARPSLLSPYMPPRAQLPSPPAEGSAVAWPWRFPATLSFFGPSCLLGFCSCWPWVRNCPLSLPLSTGSFVALGVFLLHGHCSIWGAVSTQPRRRGEAQQGPRAARTSPLPVCPLSWEHR